MDKEPPVWCGLLLPVGLHYFLYVSCVCLYVFHFLTWRTCLPFYKGFWQAGWRRVGFSSSGLLYSRHIEGIPKHFLDEIKLTVWKRSKWHKATSHWDSDSEGKFRILLKKRENYWRRSTLVLHGGKDNSPCRACPTSSQSRKHLHTPSLSSKLRKRVTWLNVHILFEGHRD